MTEWRKTGKPWQKSLDRWQDKNTKPINNKGLRCVNHKTTVNMSYACTPMTSGATHACARYARSRGLYVHK